MIKFGMKLPEIFSQLVRGYRKVTGRDPEGLDLIKIRQESMRRFEDMNKVVDMQGRSIDTSKGIMGGVEVGQKGIFDNIFNRMQSQMGKKPNVVKSDAEIKSALEKSNKDSLKNLKDKIDDPDKKADGGRIGLKEGMLAKMMAGVKPDGGIFKSLFANRNAPILSGFNTSELFDIVTTLSSLPGLAEGGRIGYKDGPPDPTKRKFIKAAVGIASLIPGIGMLGKGAKVAAPVVAKTAEITGPALAKIVKTVMDFGKLVSVKGKRVKEMVTKKKLKDVEVEEDIADGSYIIKKNKKEIYYKPGRMDETGGIEDDIIEVIEDRIKKAGGGLSYMLGE
jgi:hypothetical protein